MSSSSGVEVSEECLECFQNLKLKKTYKYILYKISDDYKSIVLERPVKVGETIKVKVYASGKEEEVKVDETGKEEEVKVDETGKDEEVKVDETGKEDKVIEVKVVGIDNYDYFYKMLAKVNEHNPRYAVYDFDYEDPEDIAKKRNKLLFYSWVPETAKVRDRMVYASSKDAIRKRLNISTEIQGTEKSEVSLEAVLDKVKPKRNTKNDQN